MQISKTYNVCALISGGKDSFYSAYLLKEKGHNIVALANLSPLDTNKDDLNSQCFQSVGHNIIPAYSEATGLPLFRGFTKGNAICTTLEYTKLNDNDEVEDLYKLLLSILVDAKELKVNAVCCGAIASNYQYNRVKHVAQRLNLHVLTPIWQIDDTILINNIIESGIEALIVKVASAGLNDKFVGSHLTKSTVSMLSNLKQQFGMNLCGEGGEYESLVLYCPLLFKKKIVVQQYTKKWLDNNPYAPVVVMDISSYILSPLN